MCLHLDTFILKNESDFEVEFDEFCQSILEARMADGCLPKCPIHGDVRTYSIEGKAAQAEALLAGWPCQAGLYIFDFEVMAVHPWSPCFDSGALFCWQGISVAGQQEGLNDSRSGLITEIFRVWDEMPKAPIS